MENRASRPLRRTQATRRQVSSWMASKSLLLYAFLFIVVGLVPLLLSTFKKKTTSWSPDVSSEIPRSIKRTVKIPPALYKDLPWPMTIKQLNVSNEPDCG